MTFTRRKICLGGILGLGATVLSAGVGAATEPLSPPTEPAILTIDGALAHTNGGGAARFDGPMLDGFRQVAVRTATPWTDGHPTFEGPRLADLLEAVGADGEVILAVAHNDYAVEIPLSDASEFGIILARKVNGTALTLRTKGPLWIIYPFDADPALAHERYYARSIWQLKKLTVK